MFDVGSFDYASITQNLGTDPFAEKTRYEEDTRFYKLGKDKDGSGLAIIAFLPDAEGRPIQQMYKINSSFTMNGKRRFVSEWSPTSINSKNPDPFQEQWQRLWNAGQKEESRKFSRLVRYITNIKVIKDPANPENNGKVFLYELSHTMKELLMKALNPSEAERALGEQPKEIFNPLRGWVFYLKCAKGTNGFTDYTRSEFKHLGENKTIYGALDEANKANTIKACQTDIEQHTYKLSDFLIPAGEPGSVMKTYDELKAKLDWVQFKDMASDNPTEINSAEVQTVPPITEIAKSNDAPKEQVQEIQTKAEPKAADDIDALLAGI